MNTFCFASIRSPHQRSAASKLLCWSLTSRLDKNDRRPNFSEPFLLYHLQPPALPPSNGVHRPNPKSLAANAHSSKLVISEPLEHCCSKTTKKVELNNGAPASNGSPPKIAALKKRTPNCCLSLSDFTFSCLDIWTRCGDLRGWAGWRLRWRNCGG